MNNQNGTTREKAHTHTITKARRPQLVILPQGSVVVPFWVCYVFFFFFCEGLSYNTQKGTTLEVLGRDYRICLSGFTIKDTLRWVVTR